MSRFFNYLPTFLFCIIFVVNINAQSPGSVSNNLGLWLRADDLNTATTTGSSGNATWPDISGSGNPAVFHPLIGGDSMYIIAKDINFNNSIQINGEWFESTLDINKPNVNVFVVYKLLDPSPQHPLWGNGSNSALGKQVYVDRISNGTNYIGYPVANIPEQTYLNHINTVNNDVSRIYIDGNLVSSDSTQTVNPSVYAGTFIGKEQDSISSNLINKRLSIAEFIVYTDSITVGEREQINSYLAIKYGITLNHNYTINNGGTIVWNHTANNGYNHNIIGVANDFNSILNITKSKSEEDDALITISTNAVPTIAAFLIGHNDLPTANYSFFNGNNFFVKGKRLRRIWKCQKTGGSSIPVDISIDSSIMLPQGVGFQDNNMVLLVSDNDMFTRGLKAYPITRDAISGDYEVDSIIMDDGQFFTIAYLDAALWIKADDNDNDITMGSPYVYHDNVLGINTMSSTATATNPTHVLGSDPSSINFNPYIKFNDGSLNQYIEKSDLRAFGNSGISTFLVLRRDNTNASSGNLGSEAMLSYASPIQHNELVLVDPSDLTIYVADSAFNNGHSSSKNMTNSTPHVFTNLTGNNIDNEIRLDGNGPRAQLQNNYLFPPKGTLIFGQEQDVVGGGFAQNQAYEGDLAEAIIFNKRISNIHRNAVETYLAIKYGVTLDNNYVMTDGTIVWDKASNLTYHNNVAGIAKEEEFELNQEKSISQNGSSVDVTIKVIPNSSISNNSYLIWGCNSGSLDSIIPSIALANYQLTGKIWKVQNRNNLGLVDLSLRVPISQSTTPISELKLIVENRDTFSAAARFYSTNTNTAGWVTFRNVSLQDNDFFSLAIEDRPTVDNYTNVSNLSSPNSFEACLGDNVVFHYDSLNQEPNLVQMTNAQGGILNISSITIRSNLVPGTSTFSGTISITIPHNAGTGNVRLIDTITGGVLYNYNNNLIIHRPLVDFYLPQTPICATDTVPLIGIPLGGIFSTSIAGLIQNDSLIGINANWSSNSNDSIKNVAITYAYAPTYLNGEVCSNPIESDKNIIIRDNRLNVLDYQYIITDSINLGANDRRLLDTSIFIIQKLSPEFRDSFNYPVSFLGNYVNQYNGLDSFLTNDAGFGRHAITMRYDNGGCIGELTNDIIVLPPFKLTGLVDTLCKQANFITLGRDLDSAYAYSRVNIPPVLIPNSNGNQLKEILEFNIINAVSTLDTNHQAAITTINTTPNNEEYRFDPQSPVLNGVGYVDITLEYIPLRIIRETLDSNNVPIAGTRDTIDDRYIALYPLVLPDTPTISFTLDSVYCKNAPVDSLLPSPIFENPHSSVDYRYRFTSTSFLPFAPSTLSAKEVFHPDSMYTQLLQPGVQNQDVFFELKYTYERYGCTTSYTKNTRVIRPVAYNLAFNPPLILTGYCKSSVPIELIPVNTDPAAQGTGIFLVDSLVNTMLIDTATNHFLPDSAQSQDYDISYQFTDLNGCESTSSVTNISIREPALIHLEIDSNSINPKMCGNRDVAILETVLTSGSSVTNIAYNNANITYSSSNFIISNDTLRPKETYDYNGVNGSIAEFVTVTYSDSFSCSSTDGILVEIYKPLLRMNGFINPSIDSTYIYCNNKSPFAIVEAPSHSFGTDTIYGEGVTYANGVYYYTPSSVVVDSFVIDIVRYEYTDALGCSANTERTVRLNAIPDVSLIGLNSAYCANDTSVQLIGMPNTFTSTPPVYAGVGVSSTGLFSPMLAGTGTKYISYSFVDTNDCRGIINDTTTIYGLPSPQFTFPQTQYCSSDTMVVLDTSSAMGTYSFWGDIINANHILNPQDSVGQQTVFYSLTDNFGCVDSSSATITINQIPTIAISGLDSAYCFNSGVETILLSPIPSTGGTIVGSAPGFVPNGVGATFDPGYDTDGVKTFVYTYEDNVTHCENSLQFNTTVYQVISPSYAGIDSVYCATDSFYAITGVPAGGVFTGTGISDSGSQYYFNPFFAGAGSQNLNYRVDTSIMHTSSYLLSCQVNIGIPVNVNALPHLLFDGPGDNSRFCSNEDSVLLDGAEQTSILRMFTTDSLRAIATSIDTHYFSYPPYREIDTSYYFSPNNSGPGIHNITYTGTDSLTGCQSIVIRTYDVTDYGDGASFILDSAYCASSDSILLTGSPAGGGFLRNQDSIPSFYLTLNTSVNLIDTIIYKVIYEACSAADTQLVRIDSLIDLSFYGSKASKTYCFGDDNALLTPNRFGGIFSGNAVIPGDSLFRIEFAIPGDNIIHYTFTDSATSCESIAIDTFHVYGKPNLDFDVVGGCEGDRVFFHPNNDILDLGHTSGTRLIDSITSITWEPEPGMFINGSSDSSNNHIDSISHIFSNPGIYQTKLYVTNRTYCIDSTTVRVVISPTIGVSNGFEYDESFESDNGNWYAEAKDSSYNELWEWGTDTIYDGINEPNNKMWVTNLNAPYTANEAAWVYGPCFDISSLKRPMIRLDHWSQTRDGVDGAVLEFQDTDGTWSPLGELVRGINWFDTEFIAGAPGNQNLSPIGWSGPVKKWVNSRYKLDGFKNTQPSKLRLRMAFGSSGISLGSFHNGFAFDNVWIGNRTRNVLLETTSNIYESKMDSINTSNYELVYHTIMNKDVILLQYHSDSPNNNDEFHQFDTRLGNVKPYIYGIPNAGEAFIDGIVNTKTKWLNYLSFEQNMLETPKFDIVIDTFQHTNQPGEFYMVVRVTALVDIPAVERYQVNMVITEDSLSYSSGEKVHAVVRKDYPSNSINSFRRSWVAGDQITLTHTYSATDLNYVPNHFQAVAFIQGEENPTAREVFQAATTRDVSGYWVGVDQIISEQELNEIKDMTLYPNPAKDYIKIDFPELLTKDYNWKLISIGGITVKENVLQAGEQSLTINNYDLPSGVYVFMVYNGNVYSQRKVIINQN